MCIPPLPGEERVPSLHGGELPLCPLSILATALAVRPLSRGAARNDTLPGPLVGPSGAGGGTGHKNVWLVVHHQGEKVQTNRGREPHQLDDRDQKPGGFASRGPNEVELDHHGPLLTMDGSLSSGVRHALPSGGSKEGPTGGLGPSHGC